MMDEKPVPEWLVERLVAGDLPPLKAKQVQSRLERRGELDRLEALRAANQVALTRYHAPIVAAEVQRRLASRRDSPVRAEGLRNRVDGLRSRLATVWKSHAELRSRLFRVSLAFVGGVLFTWAFRLDVLPWLVEPFVTMWRVGHSPASPPYYPTPVPLFPTYVRVALLGGLAFALPAMLHHFWAFMASRAGLRGTGLGLPFVATSCSVLYLGAWFASRVWLPLAVDQLTSFGGPAGGELHWAPSILLIDYVELTTSFFAGVGVRRGDPDRRTLSADRPARHTRTARRVFPLLRRFGPRDLGAADTAGSAQPAPARRCILRVVRRPRSASRSSWFAAIGSKISGARA